MYDRVLFSLLGIAALAMIALALIWPQGLGARSPGPLGHETVSQVRARQARTKGAQPAPVLSMAPVSPSAAPSGAAAAPQGTRR